jgi:hypothetical protein
MGPLRRHIENRQDDGNARHKQRRDGRDGGDEIVVRRQEGNEVLHGSSLIRRFHYDGTIAELP